MSDSTLELHQSIQDRFRPGRASGNININGNNAINPLHRSIIIVKTSAGRAGAKRHYPFRLTHLFVYPLKNRGQLLVHSANHHEEISLPRAKSRQKSPEAVNIVWRHRQRHIFHGTARRRKRIGKNRILASPADSLVYSRENYSFRQQLIFSVLGLKSGLFIIHHPYKSTNEALF